MASVNERCGVCDQDAYHQNSGYCSHGLIGPKKKEFFDYEYYRKQNAMGDRCLCVCGIYVNPKTRDFVCRHLVEPEIQHRKMMRRVCIQLKIIVTE